MPFGGLLTMGVSAGAGFLSGLFGAKPKLPIDTPQGKAWNELLKKQAADTAAGLSDDRANAAAQIKFLTTQGGYSPEELNAMYESQGARVADFLSPEEIQGMHLSPDQQASMHLTPEEQSGAYQTTGEQQASQARNLYSDPVTAGMKFTDENKGAAVNLAEAPVTGSANAARDALLQRNAARGGGGAGVNATLEEVQREEGRAASEAALKAGLSTDEYNMGANERVAAANQSIEQQRALEAERQGLNRQATTQGLATNRQATDTNIATNEQGVNKATALNRQTTQQGQTAADLATAKAAADARQRDTEIAAQLQQQNLATDANAQANTDANATKLVTGQPSTTPTGLQAGLAGAAAGVMGALPGVTGQSGGGGGASANDSSMANLALAGTPPGMGTITPDTLPSTAAPTLEATPIDPTKPSVAGSTPAPDPARPPANFAGPPPASTSTAPPAVLAAYQAQGMTPEQAQQTWDQNQRNLGTSQAPAPAAVPSVPETGTPAASPNMGTPVPPAPRNLAAPPAAPGGGLSQLPGQNAPGSAPPAPPKPITDTGGLSASTNMGSRLGTAPRNLAAPPETTGGPANLFAPPKPRKPQYAMA